MKIYGDLNSGNCLKVKYTSNFLNIDYEWVHVDITQGESRSADFSILNPMAQIPVVQFSDGRLLSQSNAIIQYLAEGTALYPNDSYHRARINALMFWEQYSHEPYIAVCRYQMVYLDRSKEEREAWRVENGEAALDFMEALLKKQNWIYDPDITVADICLLTYTRLAEEGGFLLTKRPHIKDWIVRVEDFLALDSCRFR